MLSFAAYIRTLQHALHTSLVLVEMVTGRFLAVELTSVKSAQSVLQKFHLCTSFPSVGWTNDGVVISDR